MTVDTVIDPRGGPREGQRGGPLDGASRTPPHSEAALASRVAGQGALLIGGYAAAQALSFTRNAVLGHALSKGDFGIAATLTMMLQLVEVLSDLGADRLIVQDRDGAEPRLAATVQGVFALRGFTAAVLLAAAAPLLAHFFAIPDAAPAFALAALVPLVKGFIHLDVRLAQRNLDNRAQMAADVLSQLLGLLLLWPLLAWRPGYAVVVWVAIAQTTTMVAVTHALARRPYRLALDRALLSRIVAFGWPIWASAFPLVAVYQGDRIIVGRLLGMEALAGYSVAFMVAMVPGLLAAKVGNALMLPLLSAADHAAGRFRALYASMCEVTALVASAYLAGFIVAGGALLPVVFGAKYTGLGNVVSWFALMWSLRMIQAVPGMALMAVGDTRPLLVAGVIRATALLPAFGAAMAGYGIEAIAAVGTLGELASLLYIAFATRRVAAGLARILLASALMVAPAAMVALVVGAMLPPGTRLVVVLGAAILAIALVTAATVAALPRLRAMALDALGRVPTACRQG